MRHDDMQRSMLAVETLTRDCRAYVGTEPCRQFIALLNALAETYKLDLIDVTPAGLVHTQTALRQVLLLRDALISPQPLLPKV